MRRMFLVIMFGIGQILLLCGSTLANNITAQNLPRRIVLFEVDPPFNHLPDYQFNFEESSPKLDHALGGDFTGSNFNNNELEIIGNNNYTTRQNRYNNRMLVQWDDDDLNSLEHHEIGDPTFLVSFQDSSLEKSLPSSTTTEPEARLDYATNFTTAKQNRKLTGRKNLAKLIYHGRLKPNQSLNLTDDGLRVLIDTHLPVPINRHPRHYRRQPRAQRFEQIMTVMAQPQRSYAIDSRWGEMSPSSSQVLAAESFNSLTNKQRYLDQDLHRRPRLFNLRETFDSDWRPVVGVNGRSARYKGVRSLVSGALNSVGPFQQQLNKLLNFTTGSTTVPSESNWKPITGDREAIIQLRLKQLQLKRMQERRRASVNDHLETINQNHVPSALKLITQVNHTNQLMLQRKQDVATNWMQLEQPPTYHSSSIEQPFDDEGIIVLARDRKGEEVLKFPSVKNVAAEAKSNTGNQSKSIQIHPVAPVGLMSGNSSSGVPIVGDRWMPVVDKATSATTLPASVATSSSTTTTIAPHQPQNKSKNRFEATSQRSIPDVNFIYSLQLTTTNRPIVFEAHQEKIHGQQMTDNIVLKSASSTRERIRTIESPFSSSSRLISIGKPHRLDSRADGNYPDQPNIPVQSAKDENHHHLADFVVVKPKDRDEYRYNDEHGQDDDADSGQDEEKSTQSQVILTPTPIQGQPENVKTNVDDKLPLVNPRKSGKMLLYLTTETPQVMQAIRPYPWTEPIPSQPTTLPTIEQQTNGHQKKRQSGLDAAARLTSQPINSEMPPKIKLPFPRTPPTPYQILELVTTTPIPIPNPQSYHLESRKTESFYTPPRPHKTTTYVTESQEVPSLTTILHTTQFVPATKTTIFHTNVPEKKYQPPIYNEHITDNSIYKY